MDTFPDLAVVGGRADVVDGYIMGGNEAGEVEELVEMSLQPAWHHDNYKLGLFMRHFTILGITN